MDFHGLFKMFTRQVGSDMSYVILVRKSWMRHGVTHDTTFLHEVLSF